MQYMGLGLCVFSSPISFPMIVRIRILYLIIIITSEVGPICRRLGLGHEQLRAPYVFPYSYGMIEVSRVLLVRILMNFILQYISTEWVISKWCSSIKQNNSQHRMSTGCHFSSLPWKETKCIPVTSYEHHGVASHRQLLNSMFGRILRFISLKLSWFGWTSETYWTCEILRIAGAMNQILPVYCTLQIKQFKVWVHYRFHCHRAIYSLLCVTENSWWNYSGTCLMMSPNHHMIWWRLYANVAVCFVILTPMKALWPKYLLSTGLIPVQHPGFIEFDACIHLRFTDDIHLYVYSSPSRCSIALAKLLRIYCSHGDIKKWMSLWRW